MGSSEVVGIGRDWRPTRHSLVFLFCRKSQQLGAQRWGKQQPTADRRNILWWKEKVASGKKKRERDGHIGFFFFFFFRPTILSNICFSFFFFFFFFFHFIYEYLRAVHRRGLSFFTMSLSRRLTLSVVSLLSFSFYLCFHVIVVVVI